MEALLTLPQLSAFIVAAVILTVAPGPDNLMVLSLGVARGRRAGIAFGLGCALGCLSHTALAALGISALIAASAGAFAALRIAGGLYLLWLGLQAIRHARPLGAAATPPQAESATTLFKRGLIANAINPKVILFFLAFLPQFVIGVHGSTTWQIVQLGLLFTLQAALIFAVIGWFAGSIGLWLGRRPRTGAWLDRIAGGIFVLVGGKLITAS